MAPNLDKVEVLFCRWLNSYDLLESKLKLFLNVLDTIMSELTYIFGRISTRSAINSGVKWRIWPNTSICRR